MRLSRYFLPTLKENPSEAQIVSHRLMLRSGMIYQTAAGIYSWLPMGVKVLNKIAQVVREEQNRAGAHEVIMPTIQPADLWKESGRYDAYGAEMLRMQDRHERDLLYAPTAEEIVTDIGRKFIKSYRDVPQMLYQINWKFRDEIRPRFGVMRGREFLMKDCYSFDLNQEDAHKSYRAMMEAYVRTFHRLGLTAVPVRATTGPIGGDLSHEFQVLAQTGESTLYYDEALDSLIDQGGSVDVDRLMSLYAREEEMHDPSTCPVPAERLKMKRGIEVGHVFYLGTKYSEALSAMVTDRDGKSRTIHMGCYGIGVSRLIGAIIEAHHDEAGIIWPAAVAPFHVGLLNLKVGDAVCDALCDKLYEQLHQQGLEVLYDD
ncbi:MAG: proline--tRNA ligase, partial [Holosporales bacterium]